MFAIQDVKLAPDEKYVLYGIGKQGDARPLTWRRYAEFHIFAQRLPNNNVRALLPGKIPFWSSSKSRAVQAERRVQLDQFLRAAQEQITREQQQQQQSSSTSAEPKEWHALFYNLVGRQQQEPEAKNDDDGLLIKQRITELELALQRAEEALHARMEQDSLALEQSLLEESALRVGLEREKEELERSLVEEREQREEHALQLTALKKQRAQLELEIARLEASQKSASAYGSSLSAKLSKQEEDQKRQRQRQEEEMRRARQEWEEKEQAYVLRVQELEAEITSFAAVKLKLATRLDELKAENAALARKD